MSALNRHYYGRGGKVNHLKWLQFLHHGFAVLQTTWSWLEIQSLTLETGETKAKRSLSAPNLKAIQAPAHLASNTHYRSRVSCHIKRANTLRYPYSKYHEHSRPFTLPPIPKKLTMSLSTLFSQLKRSYKYADDVTHLLTNEYVALPRLTELQSQVSWTVEHTWDSLSLVF